MGCPIRGVILDPIVAMQMGIQGQVIRSHLCSILHLAWFCLLMSRVEVSTLSHSWSFMHEVTILHLFSLVMVKDELEVT